MSRHGLSWADDEDRLLRQLWAAGLKAALIAKRLGRASDSTRKRAVFLGLPRRAPGPQAGGPQTTWTNADVAELYKMSDAGASVPALMARFGRERQSIERKLNKPRQVVLPKKPCLVCRENFTPEHKGIFQCARCYTANSNTSPMANVGGGGRWRHKGGASL